MAQYQKSIREAVEFEGVGLFTGLPSKIRILQAPPESGIAFTRVDMPNRPRIEVNPNTIRPGLRNTVVANEVAEVESVEHLLSAAHGLGLDNLEIEIAGKEVPAGDGSSQVFVDLLRRAGLVEQNEFKRELVVSEPVSVVENGGSLVALPNDEGLTISFTIDYENPVIGKQHFTVKVDERTYTTEIAAARSFCLKEEAEDLIEQGLGKGGNPHNTVIVDGQQVLETQLRFRDEFVRHKILDLVGDLAALGGRLKAHVVAVRTGHLENVKLVKKLSKLATEPGMARRVADTLLDIREIRKILPHRYPMLLIDRVIELDGYRKAVGIKNVTINEPFFMGHFPQQPIMPGVLIIEAMAQLAGALLMRKSENARKTPVLLSLDGVKLRKSVIPGDQLRIEAETLKLKSRTGEVYGRALVDGQVAAEANMKFMLIDQEMAS